MIRIGICGAGKIIGNHILSARRTDGLAVTAISSRSMERARDAAEEFGIPAAYDDHRRLIESPEVDVVLVATPNYQHSELVLRAVECGKPVMVEKPLAMTVEEGAAMVAAARKAGVPLVYAEQLPLAPKFARLAEMAHEGLFGRVYMIRQIERHAGPYSPWFFKKETAGGGALADLGCHSIAVVREIMKKRRVIRASGLSRIFTHTHGNVDDFMIVQMEFEDGTIGVAESNWCHVGGMDSVTEIFGTQGNGYADLMKGSGITAFSQTKPDGLHEESTGWNFPQADPVYENGYLAQMESLARTLRTGAPPAQSGQDGLEILKIMAAAYESAERGGGWVPVA